LHGYALSFRFEFQARELDNKNWVVDFGGLKELKQWLKDSFDHKTVVDINDPQKEVLEGLAEQGLADIVYFDGVGCEKFAEHALAKADEIAQRITDGRCYCVSCEVSEHGANSAIFKRDISSDL
jgi:6-pyruvoyltetrahydropterin/6-carboxytetrahydropterin synthase